MPHFDHFPRPGESDPYALKVFGGIIIELMIYTLYDLESLEMRHKSALGRDFFQLKSTQFCGGHRKKDKF